MPIVSFKDHRTRALFEGKAPRRIPEDLLRRATRRLKQIEAAGALRDLRLPSSNRLEALQGDRAGQHSIRVNDQWRLCFRWSEQGAEDVELVDYH